MSIGRFANEITGVDTMGLPLFTLLLNIFAAVSCGIGATILRSAFIAFLAALNAALAVLWAIQVIG